MRNGMLSLVFLSLLLGSMPGCGLITRSREATNVEDVPAGVVETEEKKTEPEPEPETQAETETETDENDTVASQAQLDTSPAPQRIQGEAKPNRLPPGAVSPKVVAADQLFHRAMQAQNDASFQKAAKLWAQYLETQSGMPGYDRARYNYAFCLFSLGRAQEAIEPLKDLIEQSVDRRLGGDARILLAESLMQAKRADEALATTFEVLPDRAREAQVGLRRRKDAYGIDPRKAAPDTAQTIRLLTIRGRIYASLGRHSESKEAFRQVQKMLLVASKSQLDSHDLRFLSANYAWRQIEANAAMCRDQNPFPERLSEKEFLAYADAYYSCAAPSRSNLCTVIATKDAQVKGLALESYRSMVLAPLELKEHLPPPAREIRKDEQRGHYEREMKALIERTVESHAKDFRSIESCHAYDLF